MKTPLLLTAIVCVLASSACHLQERDGEEDTLPPAHAVPPASPDTPSNEAAEEPPPSLSVGDDFWVGEATVGYELSARFLSREGLALSLDPAQPVGRVGERVWTLADLLVSVDYRGGVTRATWRVAGPPEVVEPYVQRLRDGESERAALTELGVLPLVVTYWGGEGATPVIPEP